jgi:hypothetical protein
MGRRQILIILAVASGLLVCLPKVGNSETMGTAFTYQGRLIDVDELADGLYDFQFKLYDDIAKGKQVGTDVNVVDVDVNDGYFTVRLDFGSVFDGDKRWLEIGVRPGYLDDPNAYTTLSPRQEVTAAPYALYAVSSGSDNDWMLSGNNMYSLPSGNVGIGTTSPDRTLEVSGILRVARQENNAHGADFSYIVDEPETGHDGLIINSSTGGGWSDIHLRTRGTTKLFVESGGNVGIGTTSPGAKLDVDGDLKVTGAYKGDIGPNNGAPFPRPAYDSGWVSIARDQALQLNHGIGGNSDNYVVDLQGKSLGGMGVNICALGGDIDKWTNPTTVTRLGFYWYNLTSSYLYVFRLREDNSADMVRVRIWVYN